MMAWKWKIGREEEEREEGKKGRDGPGGNMVRRENRREGK